MHWHASTSNNRLLKNRTVSLQPTVCLAVSHISGQWECQLCNLGYQPTPTTQIYSLWSQQLLTEYIPVSSDSETLSTCTRVIAMDKSEILDGHVLRRHVVWLSHEVMVPCIRRDMVVWHDVMQPASQEHVLMWHEVIHSLHQVTCYMHGLVTCLPCCKQGHRSPDTCYTHYS